MALSARQLGSRQSGTTLLELIAAVALSALVIVPATAMMRDGLELSRKAERQGVMTTLCVGKLEQYLALTTAGFQPAAASGNFGSEGYPELRYTVTADDGAASGGIPGRLMAISATVWYDADGDGALDAGETQVNFSTKTASLVSYQNAANPSP
jgi:hypothetical protein